MNEICPCGKPLTHKQVSNGGIYCSRACKGRFMPGKGRACRPLRKTRNTQFASRTCLGLKGDGSAHNAKFWSEGPWNRLCPECRERVIQKSQNDRCDPRGHVNMGHLGAPRE